MLDRCVGSCNALNDLSNKVCVRNKTKDLNLSVLNMIAGINESKTLTKHISCKCKYIFDGKNVIQINGGITINVDVSVNVCQKDYFWNPATCNCESRKYLARIMNDSAIICDEVIESYDEEIKTIPTNFNEKNITCKGQNFYILLFFLLIDIAFVSYCITTVSIYCYLKKYKAKQKNSLPKLLIFIITAQN